MVEGSGDAVDRRIDAQSGLGALETCANLLKLTHVGGYGVRGTSAHRPVARYLYTLTQQPRVVVPAVLKMSMQ